MVEIHGHVLTWHTGGRAFLPFYASVMEMGWESLWPQGCPVFPFVYSITVKSINSKDELEKWCPEVKVAATMSQVKTETDQVSICWRPLAYWTWNTIAFPGDTSFEGKRRWMCNTHPRLSPCLVQLTQTDATWEHLSPCRGKSRSSTCRSHLCTEERDDYQAPVWNLSHTARILP